MAGEIQLNGTSFATESSGTITINNATVGSAVAMTANQACVKTAINASGSADIFAVRAWVNVNGTTITGSGNVTSVNINGVNYEVNFTNDLPNDDYSVVGTASTNAYHNVVQRDSSASDKTVSKCSLSILNVSSGQYTTTEILQVIVVG